MYLWTFEGESVAVPRAREEMQRALSLDSSSAEGHAGLALLLHFHDWNQAAAEAEFRRAIELAPGLAFANGTYATFLSNLGRHEESFAQHKRAANLDPLDPRARAGLALAYFHARRYSDAVSECDGILKAAPDFVRAHLLRALALIELNRLDEALSGLETVMRLGGLEPSYLAWRAYALAAAGRAAQAASELKRLEAPGRDAATISGLLALGWSRCGDKARALEWLSNAARKRDAFIVQMNVEPGYDPIRNEPEFQRIRNLIFAAQ
jgi:adenylate cyclase